MHSLIIHNGRLGPLETCLSPGQAGLLTGWGVEVSAEEARERGVDAVLAKPCRRAVLADTLGRVMREA